MAEPGKRPDPFVTRDRLLQEARRVCVRATAFTERPRALRLADSRGETARLALIDDLTRLLAELTREKTAVGRERGRGDRAAGAVNAYAKAGRMMGH